MIYYMLRFSSKAGEASTIMGATFTFILVKSKTNSHIFNRHSMLYADTTRQMNLVAGANCPPPPDNNLINLKRICETYHETESKAACCFS